MNMRESIPYGYKAFTGQILSDESVDRYNAIQRRINAFLESGREAPEDLLNASHKCFSLASHTGRNT